MGRRAPGRLRLPCNSISVLEKFSPLGFSDERVRLILYFAGDSPLLKTASSYVALRVYCGMVPKSLASLGPLVAASVAFACRLAETMRMVLVGRTTRIFAASFHCGQYVDS